MHFREAKEAGLGITLHIAEVLLTLCISCLTYADNLSQTSNNTPADTLRLLSFGPDRLGHATFLNDEAKSIVSRDKIFVEICLSSNLL